MHVHVCVCTYKCVGVCACVHVHAHVHVHVRVCSCVDELACACVRACMHTRVAASTFLMHIFVFIMRRFEHRGAARRSAHTSGRLVTAGEYAARSVFVLFSASSCLVRGEKQNGICKFSHGMCVCVCVCVYVFFLLLMVFFSFFLLLIIFFILSFAYGFFSLVFYSFFPDGYSLSMCHLDFRP